MNRERRFIHTSDIGFPQYATCHLAYSSRLEGNQVLSIPYGLVGVGAIKFIIPNPSLRTPVPDDQPYSHSVNNHDPTA